MSLKNIIENCGIISTITGISFTWIWEKIGRKLYFRYKLTKLLPSKKGYILVVGTKGNIENAKTKIEEQMNHEFKKLKNAPIKKIEIPECCEASDIKIIIQQIDALRFQMAKIKSDPTIHLFYAGPLVIIAHIAAFLSNKDQTYIYQHNPKLGKYECWGKIEKKY